MTEFVEVYLQAKRMCEHVREKHDESCETCPAVSCIIPCKCIFADDNLKVTKEQLTTFEKVVRNWAKSHPLPTYPTWKKWQKENFPSAHRNICPMFFGNDTSILMCDYVNAYNCESCINTEIPEEIAKKLGIKPF